MIASGKDFPFRRFLFGLALTFFMNEVIYNCVNRQREVCR